MYIMPSLVFHQSKYQAEHQTSFQDSSASEHSATKLQLLVFSRGAESTCSKSNSVSTSILASIGSAVAEICQIRIIDNEFCRCGRRRHIDTGINWTCRRQSRHRVKTPVLQGNRQLSRHDVLMVFVFACGSCSFL
jgi:hypothetical protein